MAVNLNTLASLGVARLGKSGYYGDGGGLWLQVSNTGSKSWIFRFRFDGKRHEMGLGGLTSVGLADARAKAKECRRILSERRNPIAVRNDANDANALKQARVITFDQCAAAYIDAHRGSWKNAKHVSQWQNTLATYASPLIGTLPVSAVDTDLVVKVLSPIWRDRTETATRLRGRIESILDWATVSKFRTGENPARWRGHLENLLANPNKIAPVRSHPALPWRDVGSFMKNLRLRDGVAARAVEFAILTACRSGEIRGAMWDEVNLKERLWTIPAERMKAGREHRVPLSTSAVALLESMNPEGDVVFPGVRRGQPLSDMSLTAVLRRMGHGDITVHGLRSTFRDWCVGANSFEQYAIGMAALRKQQEAELQATDSGD